MGKVIAGFGMSLDGFIADAEDGVGRIFQWLSGGDTPMPVMGRVFMTSAVSAAHYSALIASAGAHVTGRRDFDVSRAWGGTHPMNVPAFIVTHTVPQEWSGPDSPFTFVTDGVASAIEQAKKVVGDKHILIGGSQIAQQALQAGLVDEVIIDLVPVLLGSGIRLFGPLDTPIELESTDVIRASGVTHLKYRVLK